MAEENKPDNNKPEPTEEEPVKELKLTITKNLENGQIGVQGPGNGQLYDEPLCWWLLEKAKRFIELHNSQVIKGSIVKANPSMAQQVRGMFSRRR